MGFSGSMQSVIGNHDITAGFDYNTHEIRTYSVSPSVMIYAADSAYAVDTYGITSYGDLESIPPWKMRVYADGFGYDLWGNEFDGDVKNYYSSVPGQTGMDTTFIDGAKKPTEMGFYIQDKMEYNDIIINAGLRVDILNPNEKTLNRPDSISIYQNSGYIKPDQWTDLGSFTEIQPRIGVSFPVTDKTVVYGYYGKFAQLVDLYSTYFTAYDYRNQIARGGYFYTNPVGFGLEPVRTTQYEVGFSQQFGQDLGIEVTGYFKDIRNLNSTKIVQSFVAGDRYGLYINKDYANSRGITVAVSKRPRGPFSGNIDYTYSISEGNASDPAAAFYDEQANIEPEKVLVPLDWDQRHTLNATMTYHPIKNSGISVVASYGSGLPYTTEYIGVRTSFENNAREPATYNLDMRSYYNFILLNKFQISAHINIYNLFDTQNELTVYNDTGRSTYTLLPTYTPQISGPGFNTLDEYLVRPDFYSSPRQVKIGFSVSMK